MSEAKQQQEDGLQRQDVHYIAIDDLNPVPGEPLAWAGQLRIAVTNDGVYDSANEPSCHYIRLEGAVHEAAQVMVAELYFQDWKTLEKGSKREVRATTFLSAHQRVPQGDIGRQRQGRGDMSGEAKEAKEVNQQVCHIGIEDVKRMKGTNDTWLGKLMVTCGSARGIPEDEPSEHEVMLYCGGIQVSLNVWPDCEGPCETFDHEIVAEDMDDLVVKINEYLAGISEQGCYL